MAKLLEVITLTHKSFLAQAGELGLLAGKIVAGNQPGEQLLKTDRKLFRHRILFGFFAIDDEIIVKWNAGHQIFEADNFQHRPKRRD